MAAEKKSRSGANIPEEQRNTVRVRIPKPTLAVAMKLATRWKCTVPEAIDRALASFMR